MFATAFFWERERISILSTAGYLLKENKKTVSIVKTDVDISKQLYFWKLNDSIVFFFVPSQNYVSCEGYFPLLMTINTEENQKLHDIKNKKL